VKQKNLGVAAGVCACENGAVQYHSKDYYLGNKCTKDEEWFYFLKLSNKCKTVE